jgi:hypothetical protein
MTTKNMALHPSGSPDAHRLCDSGRLIGAVLLSLVLGTWVTLVHQRMLGERAEGTRALVAAPDGARHLAAQGEGR